VKYLLLVCAEPTTGEGRVKPGEIEAWLDQAGSSRLIGNRLVDPADGWTVRLRGGKPFVTDGPFAETKEVVAGFDLLECDSDEEALELAKSHPVATFGAIEVRKLDES
jgi:hypothetical protein